MPNDDQGHDVWNQQEALHSHDRGGSSDDSLTGLSLTVALFVALGVLVLLLVLLLR